MCGIVGLISNTHYGLGREELSAFRKLLVVDAIRGMDSTGVAWRKGDSTWYCKDAVDGGAFVREHLPAGWVDKGLKISGSRWVLGHNRAATIGAVNAATAHPFPEDSLVGVHNGTIRDYKSYWPGHQKETDSASLYSALSGVESDPSKVTAFLADISVGAYALVWYDKRDDTLRFARNSERPMHLVKYATGWAFGSEEWMLRGCLGREGISLAESFSLRTNTLLIVPLDGKSEAEVHEYTPTIPSPRRGSVYGYSSIFSGATYDRYQQNFLPAPKPRKQPPTSTFRSWLINGAGALGHFEKRMGQTLAKAVAQAIGYANYDDTSCLPDNKEDFQQVMQDRWMSGDEICWVAGGSKTFLWGWLEDDDQWMPIRVSLDGNDTLLSAISEGKHLAIPAKNLSPRGYLAMASGELALAAGITSHEDAVLFKEEDLPQYVLDSIQGDNPVEPASISGQYSSPCTLDDWRESWIPQLY